MHHNPEACRFNRDPRSPRANPGSPPENPSSIAKAWKIVVIPLYLFYVSQRLWHTHLRNRARFPLRSAEETRLRFRAPRRENDYPTEDFN